jgi:DNA-binding response OmpR family regulator
MPNSSAKKKILVVEDEAEYRTLLREVLGKAGYAVFDAPTGEAGLILYREQGPDLLLLDVMLPDMTGFDFCTKVRAGKVRPNTPILFCTVRSAVSQLAKGIKAGGTDYVLKPFDPENLLERVSVALRTGLA